MKPLLAGLFLAWCSAVQAAAPLLESVEIIPKSPPKEIQAVVTKEGGAKLGKYVSKAKGPNDYPCGVGVSKIRFRIKVKEGIKERVIQKIEFLVPMGC